MAAFLITALHWFNPVAWLAFKKFGDAAEWRCDLEAYGGEPDGVAEFAESMLMLYKTSDRYVAFLPAFKSRDLTERIQRLKDYQTGTKESIMKKLLLTTLAALLLCGGGIRISLVASGKGTDAIAETVATNETVATAESPQEEQTPSAEEQSATETENTSKNLDPEWVHIKGKAVFPDGTPANRCHYMVRGDDGLGSGSTSGKGLTTDGQGRFSQRTFPSENYHFGLLDPKDEWATPVQTFAWEEGREIVFEFERGAKIEGTVRDATTGQPIPNMSMTLWHVAEEERTKWIHFIRDCDDNGRFSFRVVPQGEYYVTIGLNTRYIFLRDQHGENDPYGKKVTFDDNNDVVVDFNIPSPFVGRVLRIDGTPAPNMMVHILGYQQSFDNPSYFVTTDREGRFRTVKRPKNVVVNVWVPFYARGAYINWFDDDLPEGAEAVFQLRPSCQIKGRIMDATTGDPMARQLVFAGYSDKDNPQRKEFFPLHCTTNLRGEFVLDRIPAGIRYNLYIVPGRQEFYGGGPHEPFVEVATVIPETDGKTIELGDVTVDLTNVKKPETMTTTVCKNSPKSQRRV
jgi:5-hydroxyisourate hydrolase-like protein (transthyretin family)